MQHLQKVLLCFRECILNFRNTGTQQPARCLLECMHSHAGLQQPATRSMRSRLPTYTMHFGCLADREGLTTSPTLPATSIRPTCALPLGGTAACEVLLWPPSSPKALRAAAAAASLNSAESRVLIVSLDSLPWSASTTSAGQTSANLNFAQQSLPKEQQHH